MYKNFSAIAKSSSKIKKRKFNLSKKMSFARRSFQTWYFYGLNWYWAGLNVFKSKFEFFSRKRALCSPVWDFCLEGHGRLIQLVDLATTSVPDNSGLCLQNSGTRNRRVAKTFRADPPGRADWSRVNKRGTNSTTNKEKKNGGSVGMLVNKETRMIRFVLY